MSAAEMQAAGEQLGATMTDDTVNKLDPDLRRLTRQLVRAAPGTAAKAAFAAAQEPELEQPCVPALIHVLVRYRGSVEDLAAAGLRNAIVFENRDNDVKIAGGDIAPERLGDLAAVDHVMSVSPPPEVELALNYSVPEARARSVQSGPHGLTGRGVVIGIIDSGLDWRHGSFIKPGGGTRIRALWDMDQQPAAADGSHPAETGWMLPDGTMQGVVYDSSWINEALDGKRRMNTEDKERSSGTEGHGTHVAGIAAGNGAPRDCCAWSRHTYTGVATEAEIVAVRVGEHVHFDQALDFIRSTVTDKPLVVNISMGGNYGAHDGTTDFEVLIDNFVMPPAGFPTRVVVVAAGNAGDDKRHIHVTVPSTGTKSIDIPLKVRDGDPADRSIELWYDQGRRVNLTVIAPGGAPSGTANHGNDTAFVVNAGSSTQTNVTIDGTAKAPINDDPFFRVRLRKPQPKKGTLTSGDWVLRLTNPDNAPVEVHAWVAAGGTDPVGPFFPSGSTSEMTISAPASARRAIAVANYESRASWSDCCPSGEVVATSSRGPVRRLIDGNANPKPTIAAPGEAITSANADACNALGNCCDCLPDVCCCLYVSKGGTSMAAPHVTGAVALMLELDPTMTQEDIVRYLVDKARPGPDGQEHLYGAGKLDVNASIEWMRELRFGDDQPPAPAAAAPRARIAATRGEAVLESVAVAQRPAALTPLHPAIELLRARARALPGGELCIALVSRHFSEARRLVDGNRRVATMWHRAEGPTMLRRLLGTTGAPVAPIAHAEQRDYVLRFFEMLGRYGSKRLQASVAAHQATLIQMLEAPLFAAVHA